ncbi:PREDICTED: probable 28S ribosomal protein S16, mitochondrial [Ceratosolen solmsi marchali]|uniref:Small ribosomal subunit protein bS16m n=1 Tax=Ceratosolen solmsi marchali TaxID=326594 RepID=A0AAJ6YR93_9HYME|nr:PREDICTED: probable 28S ribosomal protein S16, mitochondrial [Ceratosolen solmsi marchali]
MPRMPLHLASGTGVSSNYKQKAIRFVRYGCANRPFYHIVVINRKSQQKNCPIEQIGTYDKSTNVHNEKLIAFNYERVQHWIGQGSKISQPFLELLGLAGMLPIHPKTYINAWRNRTSEKKE